MGDGFKFAKLPVRQVVVRHMVWLNMVTYEACLS